MSRETVSSGRCRALPMCASTSASDTAASSPACFRFAAFASDVARFRWYSSPRSSSATEISSSRGALSSLSFFSCALSLGSALSLLFYRSTCSNLSCISFSSGDSEKSLRRIGSFALR